MSLQSAQSAFDNEAIKLQEVRNAEAALAARHYWVAWEGNLCRPDDADVDTVASSRWTCQVTADSPFEAALAVQRVYQVRRVIGVIDQESMR